MRLVLLVAILMMAGTGGGHAADHLAADHLAADRPPLRMAFFPFPPFNDVDDAGRPVGEFVERFTRMCDLAGFAPRFAALPASRARFAIVKGDADVMLTNNASPELAGNILSSPEPIDVLTTEAYWVPGAAPIRRLADLDGRDVIVQLAFAYGGIRDYVDDPRHRITVVGQSTDIATGVKMLAQGRATYLIQYRNNFRAAVARLGLADSFQSGVLSTVPIYINVSKRYPDAAGLLQRLIDADRRLRGEAHSG